MGVSCFIEIVIEFLLFESFFIKLTPQSTLIKYTISFLLSELPSLYSRSVMPGFFASKLFMNLLTSELVADLSGNLVEWWAKSDATSKDIFNEFNFNPSVSD